MAASFDRYGSDVLNTDWRAPRRGRAVESRPSKGLVVEEVTTDWCGDIVAGRAGPRHGRRWRTGAAGAAPSRWAPGSCSRGGPVVLRPPAAPAPARPTRTASGSVAVAGREARVARASRIFVEGRHDAELVEKVWGDDLRVEGVVVEYLERRRRPADQLATSGPARSGGWACSSTTWSRLEGEPDRDAVAQSPAGGHVLVVGHPYIDVWQAVKPSRLGITAWPTVPRERRVEEGRVPAAGLADRDQADIARAWQHILPGALVHDLEPALLGRVEELIDFVTSPEGP